MRPTRRIPLPAAWTLGVIVAKVAAAAPARKSRRVAAFVEDEAGIKVGSPIRGGMEGQSGEPPEIVLVAF
jgi:hypothetical protein